MNLASTLSLSNFIQTFHLLSYTQKPLCTQNFSSFWKLLDTLAMSKKQNQTQATQAEPNFKNSPPSTSFEDGFPGEALQIVRLAPVSILVVKVCLKDKEPKVHIEHFFNIDSLKNVAYVIKANLMMCGIHHFFKDPKLVVPELIHEFWRTIKVYRNEVIGGYFAGKVFGILV